MKRFCLLGILGLVGCGNDAQFRAKVDAEEETRLVFTIRDAQADYEKYLKDRLAHCQLRSEVLVRDQDGILVCATPPKKTEENK